jgi:2-isopropylmalate synthase/UPF0716 protein FxsA
MVYFIIYLFIEIIVSVNISSNIGGLYTFFEVILSAVIGIFLLVNLRDTLTSRMGMILDGSLDVEEFQKASLFTILGAILLIIPGFFSDMLGLLLQFSTFGIFFAKRVLNLKSKSRDYKNRREEIDDEIIDVEVIDYHNTTK